MKTALIPVTPHAVGQQTIPTVDARQLHKFLEVGKAFPAWITERIESFGFLDNQDFVILSESGFNSGAGRPQKNYALTLDMAKELSMVERNARGKEARLYFIECERQAKQQPTIQDPSTRALIQLLTETDAIKKQVSDLREDRDVLFHELDGVNRAVAQIENIQRSICILTPTNPITRRIHRKMNMTVRQWATLRGLDYSQVRNVLSGLSKKSSIVDALNADMLLSDTAKAVHHG